MITAPPGPAHDRVQTLMQEIQRSERRLANIVFPLADFLNEMNHLAGMRGELQQLTGGQGKAA